ncbi:MAG: succinate dehydrogenase, cytochrome b556 subunit, partial [Gammaproteobacteria bacterium]|nr:succinate dehydrogenase, cytochrome b556 subunit [Gammaproteobacteria bacterium]
SSVYARVAAVLLAWALVHHLLAGLRFLLIDVDMGVQLRAARISAWLVNLCGLAALIAAAGGWL